MNFRYSLHIIGSIMRVVAALMLFPVLVSVIYSDGCAVWFLAVAAIMFAAGMLPFSYEWPIKTSLPAKDFL